jgi:hypothetical protein
MLVVANICHLCREEFDTSIAHHYMMFHPREYSEDPIEIWPDGKFVYLDSTQYPLNFNPGDEE